MDGSDSIKLLLDPIFTNTNMSKCATWYAFKSTTQYLLEQFPNLKVYAIVPPEDEWVARDDLFEETDRVIHIPIPQYRDRYKEYFFLKKEWLDKFAYWGEFWDWDICMTTRSVGVPTMRIMSTKSVQKTIITFEPLPLVKYKKTVNIFDRGDALHMQTFSGYLNSDLVVVNTQHEIDGIVREARRFLTVAKLRDLKERLLCKFSAPAGVDLMHPHKKEAWDRSKPFKVLYTQRLDKTERRPDMVFDSFKYAFVTSGNKFDFEVCTNTSGKEDMIADFEGFMSFGRPSRGDFYKKLATAQVCCSFAVEEGIPLSLFEAASFGVICVVKNEAWSRDMYGPDYPWLVAGIPEAVTAIKWIEKNYDEAYKKYLEWYDNFWLKRVAERGDFTEYFVKRINDDFLSARNKKVGKRPMHDQRLSYLIDAFCRDHGMERFDIREIVIELDKRNICKSNFRSTLQRDQFDIPLARSPAFYETRLELNHFFGWKDGLKPGTFVSTK